MSFDNATKAIVTELKTVNSDDVSQVAMSIPNSSLISGGPYAVLPDGTAIPCLSDGQGPIHAIVDTPQTQYIEYTRTAYNNAFPRPMPAVSWPIISVDSAAEYAITPDDIDDYGIWTDALEPDCYTSISASDWTSKDHFGPLRITNTEAIYCKKYGHYQVSQPNVPVIPTASRFIVKDLILSYNAEDNTLSLSSSSYTSLQWQYIIRKSDGTVIQQSSYIDYAGPMNLPDNVSTIESVRVRIFSRTVAGITFNTYTSQFFQTIYITDPREDAVRTIKLYDETQRRKPEIAIKVSVTTPAAKAIELVPLPGDCDVYILYSSDNYKSEIEIIEQGKKYTGPISIKSNQIFWMVAKHKTIEGWISPAYRVVVPSTLNEFYRLYCYRNPPMIPVAVRFDIDNPLPSGWYITPNGTGDGRSPTSPCTFTYARNNAISGDNYYFSEGVYNSSDLPTSAVSNTFAYGGFNNGFNKRDIKKNKTVIKQNHNDFPAIVPCKTADGFWADVESGLKDISLFNAGASYTRCYTDNLSLHAVQQSDGRIESTFDIFNAVNSGSINKVTFSSDDSKKGVAGYYNYYVSVRHAKIVDVSHGTAMPDANGNPNLTYFSGSYTDCGNVNIQCASGHEAAENNSAGGVSYLISFNRCETATFTCGDMHESRTQGADATVSISVVDVKNANIKFPSAGDVTVIDNYSTGGRLTCHLDYHVGLFNIKSKRGVYNGGTYTLSVNVGNAGSGGRQGGNYYFYGSTSPFALVGTNVIANIQQGNTGKGSVQNGAYEVRGMIGSPNSTIERPYYSGSSQYYGGNGAPIPGYTTAGTGSNRNGIYLGDYWQNGISTS